MLVSKGSRLEIVCRFATASEGKPALNRDVGSSQPVWFGPDGRLIQQWPRQRYNNLGFIYTKRKRKIRFLTNRFTCYSY